MKALSDLWSVLIGDGVALDKEEAKLLGNKYGQTISIWAAIESRHGSIIAHIVCLGLFLVQWKHCRDQLVGVPMQPPNYIAAAILLLLAFIPVVIISGIRRTVIALGGYYGA